MKVNSQGGFEPILPDRNKEIKMVQPEVHQLPASSGAENRSIELPQWVVKDLENLALAIAENAKTSSESKLEPYEAYAAGVKEQIFSKTPGRFEKGYQALMEQIQKEEMARSDEDKPPPGAVII